MNKALDGRARASSATTRRSIETITIPTDKIREVIGTGGKVIREIVEKTGAKVDIERRRHRQGRPRMAPSRSRPRSKWIKSIAPKPKSARSTTAPS
jgi:polyribonucleotide nucleotidyltransferase